MDGITFFEPAILTGWNSKLDFIRLKKNVDSCTHKHDHRVIKF